MSIVKTSCEKIAPFWSLENFVAVNPYLGLSHLSFEEAADVLEKTASIQMTMPVSFYLDKIKSGQISVEDIEKAQLKLDKTSIIDGKQFIRSLKQKSNNKKIISLVTDVASKVTKKDWNELFTDRITSWASVYFDKGQTSWSAVDRGKNLFVSWLEYAMIDATPRIMGIKSFRRSVTLLPENPAEAKLFCIEQLKVPEEAVEHYLHALLLRMGGWSSYISGLDWDSNLYGGKKDHLSDFLSILLGWEYTLFRFLKENKLENHWLKTSWELPDVMETHNEELRSRLILHQAYEFAQRKQVISVFNSTKKSSAKPGIKPLVQAIFCIDVRSEIFRRNIELIAPEVETIGAAGFFGFPVQYMPLGHNKGLNQCPALIPSTFTVKESVKGDYNNKKAVRTRKFSHHLEKTWKGFKQGAVSNFSFVSPLGLTYLPKIFLDAFGFTRPVPQTKQYALPGKISKNLTVTVDFNEQHRETSGIPFDEQVKLAKSSLKSMTLTSEFSRLVLIAGHGSSSVNNPHASGLDCGACGGHAGDVNAQVAAKILNNAKVRKALVQQGITISNETHFLAGLHDTTTDIVTLLNEETVPSSHQKDLHQLKIWLNLAGQAARTERAARFHQDKNDKTGSGIFKRSKDWSQIRPEWGLAGCHTFVVAPRQRTSPINLDGKSFLHNYDWKKDKDFSVLELIMTAPMVVTSWINLQYFASTVDNKNLGAGNKTLHNVTSGIGVLEGYSGDLRIGLPWQSVHDGENFQHLPYLLNVIIEAPLDAINNVLSKHSQIKNLCDNGWIHLMVMHEEGKISHVYSGNHHWEELHEPAEKMAVK
ncbi:MAG: DUF2309 domain-containing protein [Bacteroidales bacterium]|nr:DUF2309 domain-containing protein [Bacteroidales bacterium]